MDYEAATRTPTLEIAHEALIRVWPTLRDWLATGQEELRLHQRLSIATTEWLNNKRDSSYLANGSRLAQFEPLGISSIIRLNNDEFEFLWNSVRNREQNVRRRRLFIGLLALTAVVAIGLAGFAFDRQNAALQRDRADQQTRLSRSRELAVTALTSVDRVDLSLLLSLEALRAADTFEARDSLLTTLQQHPRLVRFLGEQKELHCAVAVDNGGHTFAYAGRANTITIQNMDGSSTQDLTGHTDWINDLAFDPLGRWLASASRRRKYPALGSR